MQLRVRMSARSLLEVLPQLVWSQWVFCQGNENKKVFAVVRTSLHDSFALHILHRTADLTPI